MLTIAITGSVGSGKSSLLHEIAQHELSRGRRVAGFISRATGERQLGKGAEGYALESVSSGDSAPWAERTVGAEVPYQFQTEALGKAREWIACQGIQPDLILLDEFGKLEARGEGIAGLWEEATQLEPRAVVVSLREGARQDVEQHLGVKFDRVIEAQAHDAFDQVQSALGALRDWERVGNFGAASGGLEATLGAGLHGAKVPFRGVVMSTIQAAMLGRAGEGLDRRSRVVWVAFIAAALKALSPTGNRLGPMAAITIQGVLFTLGTAIVGWNRAGLFLGGFLVTGWAVAQGFFIQYLLIGRSLFAAYDEVSRWILRKTNIGLPELGTAVLALFAAAGLVGGAVTVVVWKKLGTRELEISPERRIEFSFGGNDKKRAFALGFRDLLRPWFWIPLLIVALLLAGTSGGWKASVWTIVRAVLVGWALFAAVRLFDPLRFVKWLQGRGHWGPALAVRRAIKLLSGARLSA